jgi:hypothetical protein
LSYTSILHLKDGILFAKDSASQLNAFGCRVQAISFPRKTIIKKIGMLYPNHFPMVFTLREPKEGIHAAARIYKTMISQI